MSLQLQAQVKAAAPASTSGFAPAQTGLLQRKCGETGLSGKKLFGQPLQTKLRINEPGDQYEQEADRVTEQVMRMPEKELQRKEDNDEEEGILRMKQGLPASGTGQISGSVPPVVHEVLSLSGVPLDLATRAYMEPRFGHDFSKVKVHSDAAAGQSAREVNAHAFTVGRDIVFGADRFAPGTQEGRRLIAHELTHVVQQQSDAGSSTLRRQPAGKGGQMDDRFRAAQHAQQELAEEEARTLESVRLIVEDYYTRGERLKPAEATLLTIEEAAEAEKRGRASKPFSMAIHPAFGFSDRPVTFYHGQKVGRYTVVVPQEAIVKVNDRYYYAVDYDTMFNVIHGIVSYSEQAWENTKHINVVYGHLVKGIGHIASLGNNPLGQMMGPMMETAGEGMLYEVRKIEARKAGEEFTEEAPEMGWRTVVQGFANVAGGKLGGLSGKVVGKFAPRAAPVVGLVVGMETSTVITKSYEAVQGNIEWSDVFRPDVSPVEMLVGLVEGAVLHKFSERWTKGRAPKVPSSEKTPATKTSKEPTPEPVSGAKAATEPTKTARPVGGKQPLPGFRPVEKGVSPTLDKVRARWSKHDLEVTEEGIQLCSPKPCPLVRNIYKRELNENEQLATLLDDIELQRRANPADAGLRNKSLALEEKLGEMHARNALVDAIPEKDIANRARGIVEVGVGLDREQIEGFAKEMAKQRSKSGRQRLVQELEDLALRANTERNRARMRGVDPRTDREVEEAFNSGKVESKAAGKTSGSTAPKQAPMAQDIGLNIDENLPVGDKTVSIAERQRRALDLNNRDFKDPLTNQRTKHVKIDARDLARLKTIRKPVSLAMQETVKGKTIVKSGNEFLALWGRRFSEIVEVKAIGERIIEDMKGKTTRRPGDLKTELNSRLWDEFKNPKSSEGRIVAEAIERSGFDIVQAPNGDNVLRALTQGELKARGLRYVKGQGWIKVMKNVN